jgi:hypothetical protein
MARIVALRNGNTLETVDSTSAFERYAKYSASSDDDELGKIHDLESLCT